MYIQLVKKSPKLNEKTRKKIRGSIDEKLPKLDEETRKKTDYLMLYTLLCKDEKPLKPS